MGIFKIISSEEGVGNGYIPGTVGIWATWKGDNEVLKVLLTILLPDESRLPPFSYSFVPSHNSPFRQSLAVPQSVLEIIRGRVIKEGHQFEFQFLFHGGNVATITATQEDFARAVHGKSKSNRPKSTGPIHKTLEHDTPEVAALNLEQIKSKSDAWRAAEKEKKRAEEEKKAKAAAEAAEIEAKKKAEATKSTQAAVPAARAASSGDPKVASLSPCKTVIVYGSSTGNTKNIAEMLKDALGNVDFVKNVLEITPADFAVPENLILGIPTWHIGELQDDWAAMLPLIEQVNPNVTGKKVAIFGLGDQKGYPDTYVDAIQMLWEPFQKRGAKLFGLWPTKGYEFKKSKAIQDGKFMGLVIDIENQDHLSDERVKVWAAQIKVEMGL